MKKITCCMTVLMLLGANLFSSCKKDKVAPIVKSTEKAVTLFTASNSGASSMPVSIDNDKHTITIAATCPTNQNAITVNPTVSAKASCSMAAGTVLDLRGTKKFTITAEDGTTQEYSVFVKGCSLYSSWFYRDCGKKRVLDCLVQDNKKASLSDKTIYLSFKELSDSGNYFDEDDFRIVLSLSDTNFTWTGVEDFTIDPSNGVGSKATFIFSSSVLYSVAAPVGKISITNVDPENRVLSGSFYFGQGSKTTCSGYRDYIAGEFYSVSY
jgi:hypothetical protein